MTSDYVLKNKIRLVLTSSKSSPTFYDKRPSIGYAQMYERPRDVLDPAHVDFKSEAVDVLRAIYATLDDSLKTQFPAILVEFVDDNSAATVANALVELRLLDHLQEIRKKATAPMARILQALDMKLRCQPHLFTEQDLQRVDLEAARGYVTTHGMIPNSHLHESVERVRYFRLRQQVLENVNPEINSDQEKVFQRAKQLGFSPALQNALREIDRKLLGAASGFDFKGCVDFIRTAFETFIKESCGRIESKVGTPVPTAPTKHYQPYIQYLRNADLLLEDEWITMQKFYNLLSNEGAHSLENEPEPAKVYKNMTIEWLLLISGRVQRFLR